MPLLAKVDEDLKAAMKGREELKVSCLRLLKAAAANAAIAKAKSTLEDAEAMEVIAKLIKQREESVEAYTKGNRPELAEKERKEAAILKAYLPAAMPDEELKGIIQAAIKEAGASGPQGMGAVMKAVLPKVASRADGKKVSGLVAELLKGGPK
jgi:hypothetical protein